MKCDNCHWDYPSDYLAPLRSSNGDVQNCCGICALELSNKLHGLDRTHFDGEVAEQMRRNALKWRARFHVANR